jgi:hypothetical protein
MSRIPPILNLQHSPWHADQLAIQIVDLAWLKACTPVHFGSVITNQDRWVVSMSENSELSEGGKGTVSHEEMASQRPSHLTK